VKLLSRPKDDREAQVALERFKREAQVALALKNPHVVQIVEYQIADQGIPYIVMELLEGEDLANRIRREGRIAPVAAIRIIEAIGEALDAANELGIVHRDLKPANVFLS
jgi:eukaryotic-like serine/threonine-protein kinase